MIINRKNMFLSLMFFVTSASMHASDVPQQTDNKPQVITHQAQPAFNAPNSNEWSTFGTISTGGLVGGSMAILARMTDHLCWPLNWYITLRLRKTLVSAIIAKAKKNNENLDTMLLEESTWASDWMIYLIALSSSQSYYGFFQNHFHIYNVHPGAQEAAGK